MAYIRDPWEMLTCFQEHADYDPLYAPNTDLALVYGIGADLPRRLRAYQAAGYRCAVMFGIAWGDYQDYLDGRFDGKSHGGEGQRDRAGKAIIHGPGVPYLVPTADFCDYLVKRLIPAVDAGAEGIVMEEPELFAAAGYSDAFREAWEAEKQIPFVPQHVSVSAMRSAGELKMTLYARALENVSSRIKAYAEAQGKSLFVAVATHSVLNYAQWQILSPVSRLRHMRPVDYLIGQVWTGTARTAQMHRGLCRERIFETALLEYASLTAAAGGKRVYLLADPIEDRPTHTWEMYQKSYVDTLAACLMQPGAGHFEVCPWPRRVFCGEYPRVQPRITVKDETSFAAETARPIPPDYASVLCGVFQLLGGLPKEPGRFEGVDMPFGVFLSDTCLTERRMPDAVPCDRAFEDAFFAHLCGIQSAIPGSAQACDRLLCQVPEREDAWNAFRESTLLPDLYGVLMPLIKYGLPVRFVLTRHLMEGDKVPDELRAAVISYDAMKPESPRVHEAIQAWVRGGGQLIYLGEDKPTFADDPDSWWRRMGLDSPQIHLFRLLNLPDSPRDGAYPVGRGCLHRRRLSPARISLSLRHADGWRATVAEVLAQAGGAVAWRNHFTFVRGRYIVCSVMDESVTEEPVRLSGLYADLLSPVFAVRTEVAVRPGERAILYALSDQDAPFSLIGTQARVHDMKKTGTTFRLTVSAQRGITARIRLTCPPSSAAAVAQTSSGQAVPVSFERDTLSGTGLLTFDSDGSRTEITLTFA